MTGNLYERIDIDEEMFKAFLTNADIVALLTNTKDTPLPAKDLRYKRVFPYEHVPDTSIETGVYITFDTEVVDVPTSASKRIYLYVYVMCHQGMMNVDSAAAALMGIKDRGPRKKILAAKVDEVLNGLTNEDWVGKIQLIQTKIVTPAVGYIGDCLIYELLDFNRTGEKLYG